MKRLFAELGEPLFAQDYDHLIYDEPDYDAHIGMPGPCEPPDIFGKYADANFWLRPEANRRGAAILS